MIAISGQNHVDDFACNKIFSVSSTSGAARTHSPVRRQMMQRNTCAIPWINSSTPAATMIALN
jgi:hypothetical protein